MYPSSFLHPQTTYRRNHFRRPLEGLRQCTRALYVHSWSLLRLSSRSRSLCRLIRRKEKKGEVGKLIFVEMDFETKEKNNSILGNLSIEVKSLASFSSSSKQENEKKDEPNITDKRETKKNAPYSLTSPTKHALLPSTSENTTARARTSGESWEV